MEIVNLILCHIAILLHIVIVFLVNRQVIDARKFPRKLQIIPHETHDPFFALYLIINSWKIFGNFISYLTKPVIHFDLITNNQLTLTLSLSHCLTKTRMVKVFHSCSFSCWNFDKVLWNNSEQRSPLVEEVKMS